MLELWGMQSTPLLPSLLGSLWPGVVAPDRVLSMGQQELNCVLLLNWIVWNRTVWRLTVCKQKSVLILNWITTQLPWLVNLASLAYDMGGWCSCRVSSLQSVVAGLISCDGDHGIHCWWDLIRSKQPFSVSYVMCKYSCDFLVMVIQFPELFETFVV